MSTEKPQGPVKLDPPLTSVEQLKVLRASERVQMVGQKMMDLLMRETEGLPGPDRWHITGRVLQGLYGQHFSLSISTGSAELARREKELKDPAETPPPSVL